jgi:hypothetical protein
MPTNNTSLVAAQAILIDAVNIQANLLIYGGFTYNGTKYSTDSRMLQVLSLMDQYNTGFGQSITWWDIDSNPIKFSSSSFKPLLQAISGFVYNVMSNAQTLIAEINALTTVAQVQAFNITKGWPTAHN